jgi:riboflavin kinase
VIIRGRLVRGLGEAPGFTQLPWVVEQCRDKLGFEPYPGTVNLEVDPADFDGWRAVKASARVILSPPDPAFCDAVCAPAEIGGVPAASITPHVPGYPEDKLELLADRGVMRALGLAIGDELEVYFPDQT